MKKGFTMIELIFVIVILGILASVAIPRLASTRADAEISAAIANLRTLESDIASYHTVKGSITDETFAVVTNVKVDDSTKALTTGANLQVGKENCIAVKFVESVTDNNGVKTPAYLNVKSATTGAATGVCEQVQKAPAIAAILNGEIKNSAGTAITDKGIAIGSSTSVYNIPATKTPAP